MKIWPGEPYPLGAVWNGEGTNFSLFSEIAERVWWGEACTLGDFANRLLGSSDLYEDTGRRPFASVNFVTAHDGFTLEDLVSYEEKHNEANGEDNRDGPSDPRSWNCGVEGPTEDPDVRSLRDRHGVLLNGKAIPTRGEQGEGIEDESFLLLLNADAESLEFRLPEARFGLHWTPLLDTADPRIEPAAEKPLSPGDAVTLEGRSVVLLCRAD